MKEFSVWSRYSLEDAKKELIWSPCDSAIHLEFEESFFPVDEVIESIWDTAYEGIDDDALDDAYETIDNETCKKSHETFVAALAGVRDAGLFNNEKRPPLVRSVR